jgi:hypothetical protein
LDFSVPTEFVTRFSPGTKPDEWYDDIFVKEIQSLLFTTFEQFVIDINENKFIGFKPFMTALKFEINDIHTAIAFNQYHEALHMGHILNIRKFL